MADPIFKKNDPNQPTFLPPSLDELLGENHMVRFVNHVIDHMDLAPILETYQGGGTSSYHPQMMLKILIFGYVEHIHSCRAIAKAAREQIPFMWLAAGHCPDFRTINHFRKHRLPDGGIKGVFTQVVQMLVKLGLVDLADYTVDGTTLEANARRHSAVWAKNTERYKQSAIERIEAYFEQIQQLADLEADQWATEQAPEEESEPRWTSEDVQCAAQKAERALQTREKQLKELESEDDDNEKDSDGKPVAKQRKDLSKARTRLRWITDNEHPKLSNYEAQEQILGERSSYSRTDPNATFMRLKDQSPFDKLLAPANHRKPKPYSRYAMDYDAEEDEYRCPQDRRMPLKETKTYTYGPDKQRSATTRVHECEDCSGCPVKEDCTYGKDNRTIQFTTELEDWKQVMAQRMSGGEGKRISRYRGMEIESIFGLLKANDGLNRLAMRGLKMVGREVGLKSIAHNIRKMKTDSKKGILTHIMAALNLNVLPVG